MFQYPSLSFQKSVDVQKASVCRNANRKLCRCGEVEYAEHYFLKCSFYRNQRAELIRTVSQFCRVTIAYDCLLRGNRDLPYQRNVRIFEAVQAYIKDSKRF